MTLHESGDVTVLRTADEVAFPMSGNGAIFDLCGSFSNGNRVDDLAHVVSGISRVPRAANAPLEAKVLN
jgi:hypothetical protein